MKNLAILIRHGESLANAKNIVSEDLEGHPLTEKGIKQSLKTGGVISPISNKIEHVYSSPVQRTRETALNVMEAMNLEKTVEIDNLLTETAFGKYNNVKFEDFPKFHKKEFGIEPFEDNGKRMLHATRKHEGINLYFSHALPIKALICNLLELEEEDASGIKIENASITVIDPFEERVYSIGSLFISEKLIKLIIS
ncbi:MAG: histidine phosphatase family protein [Cuniculiplasma sp.]